MFFSLFPLLSCRRKLYGKEWLFGEFAAHINRNETFFHPTRLISMIL